MSSPKTSGRHRYRAASGFLGGCTHIGGGAARDAGEQALMRGSRPHVHDFVRGWSILSTGVGDAGHKALPGVPPSLPRFTRISWTEDCRPLGHATTGIPGSASFRNESENRFKDAAEDAGFESNWTDVQGGTYSPTYRAEMDQKRGFRWPATGPHRAARLRPPSTRVQI